VEVPAGKMPRIDGEVGEEEWRGAATRRTAAGTVHLRTAGGVLCIGLRMQRPYRGERIDLRVANASGQNYSWHGFHPACTIPPRSTWPIAPVVTRRASWSLRERAPNDPPHSCLFRARVYRDEETWSAEIALGLQGLGVSTRKRIGFQLHVLHPAGGPGLVRFVHGGDTPREWPELRADWPAAQEPLITAEEDARRKLELEIFEEFLDLWTHRGIREPVLARALDGRKNNRLVGALLEQLDGCLAADPHDFFAHCARSHLLRRANRLAEAERSLDLLAARFPFGHGNWAVAGARRSLLFVQGRFQDGLELPLPGHDSPEMRAVVEAWEAELAARARDRDLPRVAFATTRGRVVVALHEADAPRAVAHLLALVEAAHYEGAAFDDVTGGVGAWARAKPPPERVRGDEGARRAWRGSLALVWDGETAGADLRFATGHGAEPAVGRIIEGMEVVDALEAGDRIESAQVLGKR
jgi:hypothetical protein